MALNPGDAPLISEEKAQYPTHLTSSPPATAYPRRLEGSVRLPLAQPGRAALLLVDVQQGLDEPAGGERNKPGAEERAAALLAA